MRSADPTPPRVQLLPDTLQEERIDQGVGSGGPWIVILYNDDWHTIDQVVSQVVAATGYAVDRCVAITLEAHTRGRAICYTGSEPECERVAGVLRRIRLQVETDLF